MNIKTLLCSLRSPVLSQTVGRSDNQMSLCKLDSPSDLQSLLKYLALCCYGVTTGIVSWVIMFMFLPVVALMMLDMFVFSSIIVFLQFILDVL